MSNVKQVGIIGFGSMGSHLGRDLLIKTDGLATIAAVVEPDDEKYKASSTLLGFAPTRYRLISEMLSKALDGVIVSSPQAFHLDNLMELSGRKLPVLLEKPLDSNMECICEVVRFAVRHPAPIMVDHGMRYSPIMRKVKGLIGQGAVGKVCSVNMVQHCPYGNHMYRTFRRTMNGGGGMFIEKATHDFDVLLDWLQQPPLRVAAIARKHAYGGNKPEGLRCRNCAERLTCPESVSNSLIRHGATTQMEYASQADACVFGREVDVPDNETCIIEFGDGIFATYTHCYFSPDSYTTRVYEITGLEGVLKIECSLAGDHTRGRIMVHPRFGTPKDTFQWEFDYRGRIHYNAGEHVVHHFFQLMCGETAPLTTVPQAFAAEVLGYAATMAAHEQQFVEVGRFVPQDLLPIWQELFHVNPEVS